mgnify:CR=1 FL=1
MWGSKFYFLYKTDIRTEVIDEWHENYASQYIHSFLKAFIEALSANFPILKKQQW